MRIESSRARPGSPRRRAGGPALGSPARRRRGSLLEAAILDAAWEELTAVGYAHLTMEGVAARARTSKPVVYRRWPRRAELVLAAMRQRTTPLSTEIPDTGSLRRDVVGVLDHLRDRYDEFGPDILHGLMAELHEAPERVFQVVPEVMMTVLRRAAERGEVSLDRVTPRIASLPGDLLRHEILITNSNVSDAVLEEIVDDVFLPLVAVRGSAVTAGRKPSEAARSRVLRGAGPADER